MHLLLMALLAFDLTLARNEPNLEKRSDLALKNADAALTAARNAYRDDDFDKIHAALQETRASVELSFQALLDSGKNPRNSRSYKQAELATRQLSRRLDALRDAMSVVDHQAVDPVRSRITAIHEQLLTAIMSKKK